MTNLEFSNEFDVLYNNITSNQAPGLDEYEKSVFLTKAQDEIVKNYFNPKGNKYAEGFDGNEKRQIDFSMLIKTELAEQANNEIHSLFPLGHTKFFTVPEGIMMFINESLAVNRGNTIKHLNVIPLDYTEYARLMSKPFKRPLKNQAWRILTNTTTVEAKNVTDYEIIASIITNALPGQDAYQDVLSAIKGKELSIVSSDDQYKLSAEGTDFVDPNTNEVFYFDEELSNTIAQYIDREIKDIRSVVEIIPGPIDTIESYTIRYIARPKAIILAPLEGVTLDGVTREQSCELDPILHQEILQRAVELAKAAWTGDINSSIETGKRSE